MFKIASDLLKLSFLMVLFLQGSIACCQSPEIKVSRIWDKSPHNAFTDLIRFNNQFYCVFREAATHVDNNGKGDGKLRVIRSNDGDKWEHFALLERPGFDLRDASISIAPDGRLMIVLGISKYGGGRLHSRHTHVSFLNQATGKFSDPEPVKYTQAIIEKTNNPDMNWLWRVIWHKNEAYGVIYEEHDKDGKRLTQNSLVLVKSTDGIHYDLVKDFEMKGRPDETSLRFSKNDELYILVRMESPTGNGLLGRSKPPYQDWDLISTGVKLGGPNLFFTDKEELLFGTRTYFNNAYQTALYGVDKIGGFQHLIEFPSGGDNSYPGIVLHNDILYFSYYSGHEGKSNIYLAKIPMQYIRKRNKNLGSPFK